MERGIKKELIKKKWIMWLRYPMSACFGKTMMSS